MLLRIRSDMRVLAACALSFVGMVSQPYWSSASAATLQPPILSKLVNGVPFSFVMDGKPSSGFLSHWKKSRRQTVLPDGRTRTEISYRDTATELEVREELLISRENAVEIILFVKNKGTGDTPLLENILPLDATFPAHEQAHVIFHHVLGSAIRPGGQANSEPLAKDYTPLDTPVSSPGQAMISHYVMRDGLEQESYLPFFNLQWENCGIIGAVGWTGQWIVRIGRKSPTTMSLQAGQENTHFKLHAGEEIRTPRVLLIPWKGNDWLKAQNKLRRVLIAYYLPKINGRVVTPPIAHTSAYVSIFDQIAKTTGKNPLEILPKLHQSDLDGHHGFGEPNASLNYVTEQNQLELIKHLPAVGLEAYWLDAGWFEGGWPNGRGSWVPNARFPDGMAPLGDAAHKKGLKFLLWFDPEGVEAGSIIDKQHKEWVLKSTDGNLSASDGSQNDGVFRFSDPKAQQWMTELLSDRIRKWHIDIFRLDRNICPAPYWQAADEPERRGITEIRQIDGLYSTLDSLLKEFPTLEIDNANWRVTGPDLEMMRRTIGSLTRSELTSSGLPHPIQDQAQTQVLSSWIPLSANLLHGTDPYNFRSTATTGVGIGLDLNSPFIDTAELAKAIAEIKELRPFWLGNYYPMTATGTADNDWSGWQFDRPDLNAGYAVLFRRPNSKLSGINLKLQNLTRTAKYKVSFSETFDKGPEKLVMGSELMDTPIKIHSAPGSIVIRYRKAP